MKDWNIEIRQDLSPAISRIIIAGKWDGDRNKVSSLLEAVSDNWPKDIRTKFLITCGGFLQFDWPEAITITEIGDNWHPKKLTLEKLIEAASNAIDSVLDHGLIAKLSNLTDYLTIGIDSHKDRISTIAKHRCQLQVELVCLIDLKSGAKYWTGKSYPTSKQQNRIVLFSDLESHFMELNDFGEIMILGCHDLTMFNNRSLANAGETRKVLETSFRGLVKIKSPVIVLHHPHTTDYIRTWASAWNELLREAPHIELYASAGRYDYDKGSPRSPLCDVLNHTKKGNTIDFKVSQVSHPSLAAME